MKKFLPFLASLLMASASWSQTGSGVILWTDSSYTFAPTTVDSSTTFNLTVQNQATLTQTVSFGGLDAPFSLPTEAPVQIEGESSFNFSIVFNPGATGSFIDTLEVTGNVFGSASLVVSGDGIQVQLEWTPDTLAFDTTAIGQTNSQTLALSSVGDGAAVISSIDFSNDIFSVDSALSSFTIAEGTSENIVVNYAPVNAGSVDATMTLHTNDPTNATIEIALTAVGISEVSGEMCDITWTVINSPYTFVDDVTVPEGCTLSIMPGVEVNMGEFDLECQGQLMLNDDPNAVIFNLSGGLMTFEQSTELKNTAIHQSIFGTSEPLHFFGFESGTEGWTETAVNDFQASTEASFSGTKSLKFYTVHSSGTTSVTSPNMAISIPGKYAMTFALKGDIMDHSAQWTVEYKLNESDWQTAYTSIRDQTFDWTKYQFSFDIIDPQTYVQVRFRSYTYSTNGCYDEVRLWLDDFSIDAETEWQLASTWKPSTSTNLDDYNQDQVYLEEIGDELFMNVYFFYDRDGSNNYPTFEVGPFSTAAENTVLKIQHQQVKMEEYNDVLFYYRAEDSQNWTQFFNRRESYCQSYGYDYEATDLFFDLNLDPAKKYYFRFYSKGWNDSNDSRDECWQRIGSIEVFNPGPLDAIPSPTVACYGDLTIDNSTIEGKVLQQGQTLVTEIEDSRLNNLFVKAETADCVVSNCEFVNSFAPTGANFSASDLSLLIDSTSIQSSGREFRSSPTKGK